MTSGYQRAVFATVIGFFTALLVFGYGWADDSQTALPTCRNRSRKARRGKVRSVYPVPCDHSSGENTVTAQAIPNKTNTCRQQQRNRQLLRQELTNVK